MSRRETTPLSSKKFIAYLVADVSMTALIGLGLWNHDEAGLFNSTVLFTMVIVKGFTTVAYVGTQGALDRYVRVAEIAAGRDKTDQE